MGILKYNVPTRRGKRGGQHKTRFWDSCSGVNASNLVEISTKTNNLPVSTRHSFTIGCVNPRSIRNKLETFKDHVIDNSIDICAVTETWLKTEDDFIRDSLNMNGYVFKDVCRLNRTGGERLYSSKVHLPSLKKMAIKSRHLSFLNGNSLLKTSD